MAGEIFSGASVLLKSEYTDPDTGDFVDPGTVAVIVKKADGSAPTTYTFGADPEVTKDSIGKFRAVIPAGDGGDYQYRWEGGGAVQAIAQGAFEVISNNVD